MLVDKGIWLLIVTDWLYAMLHRYIAAVLQGSNSILQSALTVAGDWLMLVSVSTAGVSKMRPTMTDLY